MGIYHSLLVNSWRALSRFLGLACASTILCFFTNVASAAQQTPQLPTARIIAVGTLTSAATPKALSSVLPQEMRETIKLSHAGKIEKWNIRNDQTGIVFVLNMTDLNEAQEMLAQMPLDKAGLMKFDFIPLGPNGLMD